MINFVLSLTGLWHAQTVVKRYSESVRVLLDAINI